MSQHHVTLLLGSNLGNTDQNIEEALAFLRSELGEIISASEILYSEAVEFGSNNIFCNIAVLIKTHFSPINLLKLIKLFEFNMGRREDTMVTGCYTDRIIDIDIVKYDKVIFECEKLKIPHYKHLYLRDFSRKLLESIDKH